MMSAELQPGTEYAFREKRSTACPLERIRLIEHIRGNKWKVKWVDPNPGLIDYVTTAQIIVPWREKKDFLSDEINLAKVYEHNHVRGYQYDSPVTLAIEQIFESAGDGVGVSRGILSGTPDQVNRISARAGCAEYELKRPAYMDRMGVLRLPFDQAFELGSFARLSPRQS